MAGAIAVSGLALLAGAGVKAGPPCGGYSVEFIQRQPCFIYEYGLVQVTGVNDAGVACGYYLNCAATTIEEGYTWTPETGVVTIPRPPGVVSIMPRDISDGGLVVGTHTNVGNGLGFLGFVYDGKRLLSMGTLPGGTNSEAYAVNSAGVAVGWWGNILTGIPTGSDAFLWKDSVMHDLGPDFGDALGSLAYDVNQMETVTGFVYQPAGSPSTELAFVWQGGKVTVLPPLPGGTSSIGRAINNHKDVVGHGQIAGPLTPHHPYAYIEGKAIALPTCDGIDYGYAWDINDDRLIVGECAALPSDGFAALWHDDMLYDLNALVDGPRDLWLFSAKSISNTGVIVAEGLLNGSGINVRLMPRIALGPDLDRDGIVGSADVTLLLGAWGACGSEPCCNQDLDRNGIVNGFDLAILLASWGPVGR